MQTAYYICVTYKVPVLPMLHLHGDTEERVQGQKRSKEKKVSHGTTGIPPREQRETRSKARRRRSSWGRSFGARNDHNGGGSDLGRQTSNAQIAAFPLCLTSRGKGRSSGRPVRLHDVGAREAGPSSIGHLSYSPAEMPEGGYNGTSPQGVCSGPE
jgi:hypothetical protein